MGPIATDEKNIIPRDLRFDFSAAATTWLNQDFYLTQMFNTPSLVLPYIEGFVNFTVIQSLNQFENTSFHERCLNFIKQEALHAREHAKYNKVLHQQGLVSKKVTSRLINKLHKIKKKLVIIVHVSGCCWI